MDELEKRGKLKGKDVQRVVFNEITKTAVTAFQHPRTVDRTWSTPTWPARWTIWSASTSLPSCGASCRLALGRPGASWRCG